MTQNRYNRGLAVKKAMVAGLTGALCVTLFLMMLFSLVAARKRREEEESSGAGGLTGNAYVIYTAMSGAGYSDVPIAAAIGNAAVESGGGNIDTINATAENSIGAFGMFQWLGGRRNNLQNFAESKGTTEDDAQSQAEFFVSSSELGVAGGSCGQMSSTHKKNYEEAEEVDDATEIFWRWFERPGESDPTLETRQKCAEEALARIRSGNGSSVVVTKALQYAKRIADDDTYKYPEGSNDSTHWDCSHFVYHVYHDEDGGNISDLSYEYTGKMIQSNSNYLSNGFEDVTSQVNLSSQDGLQPGDILIIEGSGYQHTAIYWAKDQVIEASHVCANRADDIKIYKYGVSTPWDSAPPGADIKVYRYKVSANMMYDGTSTTIAGGSAECTNLWSQITSEVGGDYWCTDFAAWRFKQLVGFNYRSKGVNGNGNQVAGNASRILGYKLLSINSNADAEQILSTENIGPGSIISIFYDNVWGAGHIGIVEYVDKNSQTITWSDGNTSNFAPAGNKGSIRFNNVSSFSSFYSKVGARMEIAAVPG